MSHQLPNSRRTRFFEPFQQFLIPANHRTLRLLLSDNGSSAFWIPTSLARSCKRGVHSTHVSYAKPD